MKHIVQFSGGAGSWAAAKLVAQEHGTQDMILLFADTRMEDQDLYRFLVEASSDIRVPLTVLADGRDPWQVFRDVRFLGNTQADPCSRILKRELCKDYIKKNWSPEDCVLYVGIDWTEIHRMPGAVGRWKPYRVEAPLCQPGCMLDKPRCLQWLQNCGIKLPRLYSMGFPHNNCGGFCIKAGQAHFLHLLKQMPERYRYHEEKEQEMRVELGDVAILRDRRKVDGKKNTRPLTLRELREREAEITQTEDGQLDWGGCGCFLDGEDDEGR